MELAEVMRLGLIGLDEVHCMLMRRVCWAFANIFKHNKLNIKLCDYAAYNNYPGLLEYFHENGHKINEYTLNQAVTAGCIIDLQHYHNTGHEIYINVIYGPYRGSYECVKYLLDNGICRNSEIKRNALLCGNLDIIKLLNIKSALRYAVRSMEVFEYLINRGAVLNTCVAYAAAYAGSMDVLKYMHDKKYDFGGIMQDAATGGHLNCVEQLCEWGYPITVYSIFLAKYYGNYECAEYLKQKMK